MKILHVISMGHVSGGAEKSVVMLKQGLEARGHAVRIMSSDRDPDVPHFSDYECKHIQATTPLGLFRHLWNGSAYRTLKNAIVDFNPDVVHFHTMGELSPSVLFALGGTPAILTVHGPEEYTATLLEWYLPPHVFKGAVSMHNLNLIGMAYYGFFKFLQRPLYKVGFRRLKLMVSPSKYLAQKLVEERFRVPIDQVYNGIDLPKAASLPDAKNVLYIGRLEHVKGVEVLLRALPAVTAEVPDVHLDIVGDGPDRRRLEALANELVVNEWVTFRGWLQGKAVTNAYKNARVQAVPSIWPENLPTVVIEALAVGRPVVGSRVGGIPELIRDGVTGKIVEPGNSDDLAKALISLLKDPNLANKADAAHTDAERFALPQFITHIEKLYGDITE